MRLAYIQMCKEPRLCLLLHTALLSSNSKSRVPICVLRSQLAVVWPNLTRFVIDNDETCQCWVFLLHKHLYMEGLVLDIEYDFCWIWKFLAMRSAETKPVVWHHIQIDTRKKEKNWCRILTGGTIIPSRKRILTYV